MKYWYKEKDWVYIGFNYNPVYVATMKEFGAFYNYATKEWSMQLGLESSILVKGFIEENGFIHEKPVLEREIPLNFISPIVDEKSLEDLLKYLKLPLNLRNYQIEGLAYMINHENCINGCSCGLGKAQPLDIKIPTPKGFVVFGDLNIGDEIFGSDGSIQKVTAIFPQGVKDCYKITFTDGSSTECCDEHLWCTYYSSHSTKIEKAKKKIVSLKEIMHRGLRGNPSINKKNPSHSNYGPYYWKIPLIENPVNFHSREVLIDPYTLGFLIGDGSFGRHIQVSIGEKDQETILSNFILPDVDLHCYNSVDFTAVGKGVPALKQALEFYNLRNKHSFDKFIPDDYKFNSEDVRRSILQGLIDSDGYVSKGGLIEFACTSEQLIKDISFIVKSLGGVIRPVRKRKSQYKSKEGVYIPCRDHYRIGINVKGICCRLERKQKLIDDSKKILPLRSIKEIEYVGKKEMQCISVSNADGLYICGDDFIVTHNTRQSIAYAELLNTFPCLIVCPSTVKTSWEKEWHRCNPKRTIHIIDSKDAENTDWKADVTIINYDFLYMRGKSTDAIKLRYRSLAKKWGLVIFDEIHLCKNEKALRSKAVKKIAKQAIHKIALSGTLITNRPKELINILEVLGKFKEIFPDKRYFLYRYCNARKTPFGVDANGASCTLELHEIIKHYCYFRKERREVLTELPPVVEQKINVPIANKKEYEKAEKDFIAYLSEIDIDAAERAERAEHLVRLSNLKRLSLKGKLKFIVQFLKDWQESDEDNKLIIFGIFTEPLEELYETFKKDAVLVTGKRTTTDEKMERIEQFKESKQFLFANIATLSTGVDGLQDHCSNMVFIEWPSTPKDLEQAQSRIDRMGQKKSMNIYHLLSDETVDLDIQELIKEKTIITNAVNRGIDSVSNSIKSLDWELLRRLKQKNEDPNKRLKT